MDKTAAELMQDPKVVAYLDQLAVQIVRDGFKEGDDITAATEVAHAKRRKFATELLNQSTRRAQLAKRALSTPVFIAANVAVFRRGLRDGQI
ncbi:hypothetical protein [Roseateles cavernae]|uniref:hypothetical protein n=1 Tax=Roseateles cavernae TaxID=3153578 RepID=UPI0032E3A1CF